VRSGLDRFKEVQDHKPWTSERDSHRGPVGVSHPSLGGVKILRTRTTALAVLASAVLVIALAGSASAIKGGGLPVGSRLCSDQLRTSGAVGISGYAFNGPATFTVLRSSTAGGQETEVLRLVSREFYQTWVAPTGAGTFFYRSCLTNTSREPIQVHRLHLSHLPGSAGVVGDIGPHTAVLGPNGTTCGEFAFGNRGRLVATANVPVQWALRGFNEDYALAAGSSLTAATVDQVIELSAEIVSLEACVTNTSGATSTLSWELDPA
jgi:hypothetical protein